MNDPDRRRSPDGMDDDAIFADIVAHLNDEAPEPERAVRPVAADRAADHQSTDETSDGTADETAPQQRTHEASDSTASETAHDQGTEETGNGTTGQQSGDSDPQAVPTPQVWRAHEVDDEYEDHFEPPPVTPLPVGDLQFWAILFGMTGGPLLLLYLAFFRPDVKGYWILTAIAMSIGGFALLVSRMPGHHEDDDDGARL